MAVITSIKQQKNKNRVNVYLDNEFGFGIDLDNFITEGLKIGQEITETDLERIVKKAEFQKTLDKLLNFAMVRPRSEKEFKDWLFRKKVPDVMHKDLFSKLKYFELVDDTKFAKLWVEDRLKYKFKSKKAIEFELRSKGVNKEIINKALSETEIDEDKVALATLTKRQLHWEAINKSKRQRKMIAYLVSKGFGFGLAQKVTRDYNTVHGKTR